MHYPNLTFHGVEAIRLGSNTPHRCTFDWQAEAKSREVAISDVLLTPVEDVQHSVSLPLAVFSLAKCVFFFSLIFGVHPTHVFPLASVDINR
jgi:hypothetical protein